MLPVLASADPWQSHVTTVFPRSVLERVRRPWPAPSTGGQQEGSSDGCTPELAQSGLDLLELKQKGGGETLNGVHVQAVSEKFHWTKISPSTAIYQCIMEIFSETNFRQCSKDCHIFNAIIHNRTK